MDIMLNFRVPPKIKEQLEKLAEATGRSKTYLAVEALQSYLDEQAWQIADIRQGIKEADALDFATPKEVAALKKKLGYVRG
ncbi:MAG: CopG family ribbon-helix-helix protein [Casimicrobiaceae bacterium]